MIESALILLALIAMCLVGVISAATTLYYRKLLDKILNLKKEEDSLESEKDKAKIIIDNAQKKAAEIIASASLSVSTSQSDIQNKVDSLQEKEFVVIKDYVNKLNESLAQKLNKTTEESLLSLKSDLEKYRNDAYQKSTEQYNLLTNEIKQYKETVFSKIEDQAKEILLEAIEKSGSKAIPEQIHTELILNSINSAKERYEHS